MLSKEELRKKAQGTEQNQNTSSKKTNSSKILSQEELVKKANVKYKTTQKDVDFVNSLYKAVNNYVDSYNTDIKNLNFNTASELRDKYAQQVEALRKQAEAVKNTVKYLDLQPLEQEQITKDIDEMLLNIGTGSNLLGEVVDIYSQFGSEEEYNQTLNFIDFTSDAKKAEMEAKKQQQVAMADIIDRYGRSKYENYSINPLKETPVAGPQGVIKELANIGLVFDDLQIVNGDVSKFETDLQQKYAELSGEIASYEGMVRAIEFEKKVQKYKTQFTEDGTIKEWEKTGSKDYASDVAYNGEMTNDEKEIYNVLANRAGQQFKIDSATLDTYVTDGKYLRAYEKQIKYERSDKDVAKDLNISVDEWKKSKRYVEEFLDYSEYLEDAIAQRKGTKIAEGLKGKTVLEELYSLWGGVNNWTQGVSTAITKDIKPNATTYASAMVRDDLTKNNGQWGSLYGMLYDAGTTTGQMLPSIAMAYISGGVSGAFGAGAETAKLVSSLTFKSSFGASAYGNAYSEMINAGYREGQAKAYATMSAASEVLLQDLLGGIGKFSGKLTNSAITKVIENIDNAFLKVVASGTVSSMGEFTEESLQEVIAPIFKLIVTQDVDPIDWGDVIYAGVMGALTSGAFSAASGTGQAVQNVAEKISNSGFALTQKGVKNLSVTRDIYDFASTMPESTMAYKLSQVAAKGGNAYNMVSELAHQKKPLTEAQSEALKTRLTEDGYTPELASKIVDSAVKVSNNISVMSEQKKAIQQNALLTSAILEVVTEADAKTLGLSEQFNNRKEETTSAREEVHKKITENIVKTAENKGETITTEEASTKGREALKTRKNATVRTISDVVLSRVKNPDLSKNQLKKNEQIVTRIGEALGYKVIIENYVTIKKADGTRERVNGYIDRGNKEIHLSRSVDDPIAFILKHEITHSGENTKAYTDFVKKLRKTNVYREYLASRTGIDGTIDQMEAALGNEIKEVYASKGIELTNEKGKIVAQDAEIVADFVGYLLFNSETKTIENLLNELDKPTRNKFIQLLLDIIDTIKNALKKGDAKLNSEIATLERQLVDMLKDAGKETEKKANNPGIRYSISGVNAKTANSSMLLKAEHMLDAGADSETVRQETGWYKGYDGKMRFEIDDSKSELIENPNLEKHEDAFVTYFTGKLADILKHDDLYEAYPQLRNVNIVIQPTDPGTRGIYQPNSNYITLSLELFKRHTKEYEAYLKGGRKAEIERIEQTPEYKEYIKWYDDEELAERLSPEEWIEEEEKAKEKFFSSELGKRYYQLQWGKPPMNTTEFGWGKEAREVLMHEIQHAVQKIENFASGSTPEYWQRKLNAGDTIKTAEQEAELKEAEKKHYEIFKQNPTFFSEMQDLLISAPDKPRGKIDWDTLEQIEEDPIEWQEFDKKRDALEEKYGTLEVFDFVDLYHKIDRLRKETLNADDAYYNTAGEIEARDTANRLNLNAEERKAKRPDIDNKRVVFADLRYSVETDTKMHTHAIAKTDSDGNKLSDAQREFFKDSKVRDEEGNLLVVYHGTNAEFYTFNKPNKNGWLGKGIYFTVNKGYARKNGRRVIKTYLNLTNPYIATSNDHFGVLAELQNIYPQIDSFNITDVLQENGYDGIIMNDWDKGLIISAFEPNQAKLTTNTNPTSNPDIRYSVESTDVAKFKPIARQLMRNNQIDGDVEDFAKVLKNSFVDVSKDDVGSYEGVMPAVKWLQKNAKTTVHLDDYSRDVLSTLRRFNVYLDDVQREEVISAFDSYGDFRKKLMGSITISKKENARESLDTAWQELADTYPEIFDADTSSADMPAALLMAVNDLRSGKFNAEDGSVETDEADLISQVYESYLENIEKFEDKKPVSDYAEQVDELTEKLENETKPFKQVVAEIGKGKLVSSEASSAYNNGYMPKSLWTKEMFVYAIHEINPKINVSEMPLEKLQIYLKKQGTFGTGKFSAKTDFYGLDESVVKNLTQLKVDNFITNTEDFTLEKQAENPSNKASEYADRVDELGRQLRSQEITLDEYKKAVDDLYKEAGEKYGTIKSGEMVTGDEDFSRPVPKKVGEGMEVRRFVRTAKEATPSDIADILTPAQEAEVLKGQDSYVRTSNEENIKKALADIANGANYGSWHAKINDGSLLTAKDVALGELLLEGAFEKKDAGMALKLIAELSEVGTRLGQAVQTFSLLKRMGGLGKLLYVQQAVNTLNKDLEERFGKQIEKGKIKKVKIDENLAMRLAESETKEDFAITYEAIMRDIASQVPSTFLDKWNAWRYMAMLANPVTMIRNLVGNAFFAPAVMTKNFLATSFESISKPEERTKTFKPAKEYKEFAKNDWAEVEKIITHGGKYNYSTEIDEYRTIFKSKVLEGIRKGYTGVLEGTDALFLKGYYRHALSGYLAANKADLNNLSKETLAKAREYAMKEAQKATYRDASKLSSALNQLSRGKWYGPVIEGVLPFKKTPINILKRGVEYSPIGLVKTLSKGLFGLVTDNKMSATDFCDGLASGLTGTGLFAVGMYLMASGLVTIGFDDDEKWWRKLNGEQEFAITVWGKSYTIDWMAPACMPLFMGAAVYDALTEETNENPFDAAFNAGWGALDVIVNMSMLQGISNLINGVKFEGDGARSLGMLPINAAISYVNQAVPTIGGKIANVIDDTRRTPYVDKAKGGALAQSELDDLLKKIPFASKYRQPYVDAWGEEEKTGPVWQRILQNFVSPGYFSEVEANKVTEEISRLYKETKDKKILPDTPDKKVSFKGITKNLTGEEYYIYATTRGQKNADYLAEMVENEKFLQLTTEQQVKVIKNLYEFSDAYSKSLLDYTYADIVAMDVVNVTEEEYNKLSKETKTALAKAFFLKSYGNETKLERNGGSVVDYYIDKEIKASKTPQKEKKKQSVSEAIKNFS